MMYDLSRGAECDTDHYLVVATATERLSVSKRLIQKFDMDRYVRKPNETEVTGQYQLQISNRFAALEKLDDKADITGL
jgi:hypothetical protein